MGKYDPLRQYLAASDEPLIKLSFGDIERIIGDSLPPSARQYPAWWANSSSNAQHPYARAWLDAGYRTQGLDLNGQTVQFVSSGAGQ